MLTLDPRSVNYLFVTYSQMKSIAGAVNRQVAICKWVVIRTSDSMPDQTKKCPRRLQGQISVLQMHA